MGRLRAESLNLVDAELSVRITPDGYVTVSTGDNARPIATGVASKKEAGLPPTFPRQTAPANAPAAPAPALSQSAAAPAATDSAQAGLLAGLDWLDSLSLTGLDGQNLNEIGLKNGSLIVDDQQRGNKWNFQNISLSLRRPSGGGVALSVAEDGAQGWSLRVTVGPPANGVRSVDIKADKVSTTNILLALRLKNLNYSANLPLSGELKGELGRDGLPTYFRGKITAGAGEDHRQRYARLSDDDRCGRSQSGMGCQQAGAGGAVQDHFRPEPDHAARTILSPPTAASRTGSWALPAAPSCLPATTTSRRSFSIASRSVCASIPTRSG